MFSDLLKININDSESSLSYSFNRKKAAAPHKLESWSLTRPRDNVWQVVLWGSIYYSPPLLPTSLPLSYKCQNTVSSAASSRAFSDLLKWGGWVWMKLKLEKYTPCFQGKGSKNTKDKVGGPVFVYQLWLTYTFASLLLDRWDINVKIFSMMGWR